MLQNATDNKIAQWWYSTETNRFVARSSKVQLGPTIKIGTKLLTYGWNFATRNAQIYLDGLKGSIVGERETITLSSDVTTASYSNDLKLASPQAPFRQSIGKNHFGLADLCVCTNFKCDGNRYQHVRRMHVRPSDTEFWQKQQ